MSSCALGGLLQIQVPLQKGSLFKLVGPDLRLQACMSLLH